VVPAVEPLIRPQHTHTHKRKHIHAHTPLPQARKLKDYIDDIRRQYTKDWSSSDMRKKQVGPLMGWGRTPHPSTLCIQRVYVCACV
jgi:hypothetical protein